MQRPAGPQPPLSLTAWGSIVTPRVRDVRPNASERHRELDGHRGLAVLGIVIYHAYQFSNVDHYLYLGTAAYTVLYSLDAMVPWFFVLSAYLLFEPIVRSILTGGQPISARGFLTRRAVRLLPVYYVAILVVWFLRQHSLPGDWRDLLEHLSFTQVFDHKRIFYTNGPAWSLSVAVYFYLLLIVAGVSLPRLCRRIASTRGKLILLASVITALAAVSLGWKAWSFGVHHKSTTGAFTTWFGPMANFDNFAIGMAVALVVATLGERQVLNARGRLLLRFAGLGVLVVAFVSRQPNAWPAVYFSTECSVGFGCLVAAAVLGPPQDLWARAISWRPLCWLGGISFSVYLWHEPVMLALGDGSWLVHQAPGSFVNNAVIVTLASIVVGWLSFVLIERPTSRLGGIFRRDGHLSAQPTNGESSTQTEWESFRTGNPL